MLPRRSECKKKITILPQVVLADDHAVVIGDPQSTWNKADGTDGLGRSIFGGDGD